MRAISFFEPVFKEKIWGGSRMRTVFGMDIPSDRTGECWLVSALPEGQTPIRKGAYEGWTLRQLWEKKRELFGNQEGEEFPLLVKIIDARDDLSVQVHPDEKYAALSGNSDIRAKSESWYVLDCDAGAEIIFGHNAATKAEFAEKVRQGRWDQLLERMPVKKNDFIYVPGGTVHALNKGVMVLEIQQSSDTTYRLYDYDRLENGKPRKLHMEEAIGATAVPHIRENPTARTTWEHGAEKTVLAETPFFSIYRYRIEGEAALYHDQSFLIAGVVEGEGQVDGMPVGKGDHFMLFHGYGSCKLEGKMTLIASTKI